MKKTLFVLGAIALVCALVAAVYIAATPPKLPDPDSRSAAWVQSGPFPVATIDRTFTDTSRTTPANRTFQGAPYRELDTRIWYPENAPGPHPLVMYSHGFMSDRSGVTYLARLLASHGYVVAAPNFPLTKTLAPGGPQLADVVNQPGDISFLITTLLRETSVAHSLPWSGRLEPERVAAIGISLGGLTSTLLGFHPRWQDERLGVVVSIAGPAYMFTSDFFTHADIPFYMLAATADVVVPYAQNAADIPRHISRGALVTVEQGSHVGFAHVADPYLRPLRNPDALSCFAIRDNVEQTPGDVFADLGDARDGVNLDGQLPELCAVDPLPETLHPGRQHVITQVALLAMLEAHFSHDAPRRAQARQVLEVGLPADFSEVSVQWPQATQQSSRQ